jgi:hypothetical protein
MPDAAKQGHNEVRQAMLPQSVHAVCAGAPRHFIVQCLPAKVHYAHALPRPA